MAGKGARSGQKSRLSGRRGPGDARKSPAKRQKSSYGIKQYLQPRPAAGDAGRDSSSEPEDAGPSQTPAVGLLAAAAVPQSADAPTAAGVKLQTALLKSLQHRFATQQALETPAVLGGVHAAGSSTQLAAQQQAAAPAAPQAMDEEEDAEEEEDGFQIFSQLAYEPTFLSQRPPELGADAAAAAAADASQQLEGTQLHHLSTSQQQGAQPPAGPPQAEADDAEWPASQQLSQPAASQQEGAAQRRASGVPAAHKTTPALHSSERVRCDAGPSGQKMFPLFRPRSSLKRLYIVRHGESTYNAAAAKGPGWADPQIFDAALTTKGKQQAIALRQDLAKLNLPADTLWLTSPLQRAMQTLLLACPTAGLLAAGGGGGGGENSSAAPNGGGGERPPTVVVLHQISEKVVTCGDIGTPASELRRRFPELDAQLAALPELWWHAAAHPAADKTNCALRKRFGSHENKQQLMARIAAFRRWLQDRPESVVVAVGHSSYWRTFEETCTGCKPERMRNCDHRLINF